MYGEMYRRWDMILEPAERSPLGVGTKCMGKCVFDGILFKSVGKRLIGRINMYIEIAVSMVVTLNQREQALRIGTKFKPNGEIRPIFSMGKSLNQCDKDL